MNTRKVFFGILAIAFMAMTAVSTGALNSDTMNDTPSIDKKTIKNL